MGARTRTHRKRKAVPPGEADGAREAGEDGAPVHMPGPSPQARDFEAYYRRQRILMPGANDDEVAWTGFVATLRRPLPVTFRINQSVATRPLAREALDAARPLLAPAAGAQPTDDTGRPLRLPTELAWCNGWQLGCSAGVLKRPQHAYWSALNEWLTSWSALGVVSRQAVDSMAPVSMLGVRPQHRVLDLCASPGSKTTQLIDAMHADEARAPTGVVVANDFSLHRAKMLVRRCAALGAAAARVLVTAHSAQRFPDVSGGVAARGAGPYDRIVCDVPCCGDGTLRKNPESWNHWRPSFAQALHGLQLQIALRGCALLALGGELAYSTCAFNPIENEAVVAEVLRRCGGAIELVDVSARHPGLRRREGLAHWLVIDDHGREWPSADALEGARLPARVRRRFHRSMWPPAARGGAEEAGAGAPPLHRCVRLLPHLNDTGGFFIAVLRKVRPWPPPQPSPARALAPPAAPPAVNGATHRSAAAVARNAYRAFAPTPRPVRRLVSDSLGVRVSKGGVLGNGGPAGAAVRPSDDASPLVLLSRTVAWAEQAADAPAGDGATGRAARAAPSTRLSVFALRAEAAAHALGGGSALEAEGGGEGGRRREQLRIVRCGFKLGHTSRSGALQLTHTGAEAAWHACGAPAAATDPAARAPRRGARFVRVSRADLLALLSPLEAADSSAARVAARLARDSEGGAEQRPRKRARTVATPLRLLSSAAREQAGALGCGPCVLVCPDGAGGTGDGASGEAIVVPAVRCTVAGMPSAPQSRQGHLLAAPGAPGSGASGAPAEQGALRAVLMHEPGLENLPRAFVRFTAARLRG